MLPSVDVLDGTPATSKSTVVKLQDSIVICCSNVHMPADPITEILYSPADKSLKPLVSKNV